jgi:hypothetical protein
MVPDRAGADTRVDVHFGLGDLQNLDGAWIGEETWLRARAGEHGYLSGKDAEAVACDALIVPVVTGSPDWTVIGQMIALIADAYAHARRTAQDGQDGQDGQPDPPGHPARPQPHPGPMRTQVRSPCRRRRGRRCSTPSPAPPRHRLRLRTRGAGLRPAPRPPGRPLNGKGVPLDVG